MFSGSVTRCLAEGPTIFWWGLGLSIDLVSVAFGSFPESFWRVFLSALWAAILVTHPGSLRVEQALTFWALLFFFFFFFFSFLFSVFVGSGDGSRYSVSE